MVFIHQTFTRTLKRDKEKIEKKRDHLFSKTLRFYLEDKKKFSIFLATIPISLFLDSILAQPMWR